MRCFISIGFPCEETAKDLLGKLGGIGGVKCVDSLHLTLSFLGDVEDTKPVEERMAVLKNYGTFEVELSGVGCFPNRDNPRVIWIGIGEGVETLMAMTRDLTIENFSPHVTIARVKYERNLNSIRRFIDRYSQTMVGKYMVKRVSLMKSTLTPAGPIYEELYGIRLSED